MIVRMKKVTLLCIAARRDETLDALRNLGVMHLSHTQPPAGDDLDQAHEKLAGIRHALGVLRKSEQGKALGPFGRRHCAGGSEIAPSEKRAGAASRNAPG